MFKCKALVIGIIMLLALSLTVSSCLSGWLPSLSPTQPSDNTEAPHENGPIETNGKPSVPIQQPVLPSTTEVVAKVKPSVVAINVEVVNYDIFNQPTLQSGAGSGWIYNETGLIITNNHVVEGAETVNVTLDDGRVFTAEDIRRDPTTDLAVVIIDAVNLPAVDIGDSDKLRVGDRLVAIGNSLGMGISATDGIVSALGVIIPVSPGQSLYDLVQTDAAINPGNSGGPLINMAGEVIGINSIKIAQVGVEGMGYAISINEAIPIISELIKVGYIIRPWLGISAADVNASIAQQYDLPVDQGVLVTEVVSRSPADQSGIEPGDIITALDGIEITNVNDLVDTINSYEVGDTIEITYLREDREETVQAILAERPPPDL